MKLIIDVPKDYYRKCVNKVKNEGSEDYLTDWIAKGISIPDNATNGDMIKIMFPELGINSPLRCDNLDWWNTHYTGSESEE